jgi:hypothetical protein
MSEAFSSTTFCHDHRQEVRETVPAMKHPALARLTTAAIAVALAAAISAGTVIVAVPASAAGISQTAISPAQAQSRKQITDVFNEINTFRASKGLAPVRLGLDATAVLQDFVDHPGASTNSPDSFTESKRIGGYASFGMSWADASDRSTWANNHLLTQAGTNVVGLALAGGDIGTTAYAYKALPSETFTSAADYFAYLDLPQLQGPAPKLLGTAAWDSTLTVDPGAWPAGTKLSYQWFHTNENGYTFLVDGTGKTYRVYDYDMGRKLSVRLTATLPGRRAAVLYSASTTTIQRAVNVQNSTAPSLSGVFEAGQRITVNPGTWEAGTKLTFRWPGGPELPDTPAARTYSPDHAGAVSVQVTGSIAGKRSTTVTTAAKDVLDVNTGIPRQTFGDFWRPREGAPAEGEEFHAFHTGDWLSGTTLALQWTRNGQPIPDATKSNYKLTRADVGTKIALSVTGTRPGNKPRTVYAEPSETIVALRPPVANTKLPTINGTGLVGKTLTVNTGSWTPGTRFTYQWTIKRGVSTYPISGATSSSYTPSAQDDGGTVSVDVFGWKDGYAPLQIGGFTGKRVTGVEVHKALVVTPRITGPVFDTDTGTVYQGQTLTANVWKSGAALTFQWKRNGVVIPGATKQTYKTGNGDAGKKITVTVTGKLAGLPKATVTSAPTTPVVQLNTQYFQMPTYSWGNGTMPVVGQTVKVLTPGKWTAGAKLIYQWKRSGTAIKGATGSSYKVVSADVGKLLTVDVTGQVPDYLPVTVASIPTPVRATAVMTGPQMPPMFPGFPIFRG